MSDSPSVDELSAALGLTLILNKMDKRATAIFSGSIPPAITFLDPQKTFEGTVDSLRDFIIALDKEKADHLRYKVDGDVVKIFITPYRTTLSQKDLEFSQGDYNVEMVIALGVKEQDHLDKALSAHGRILHDATVATISVGATPSKMGSIDWRDAAASSLCEMLVSLSEALKEDTPLLDEQVASAFLTGIVSATDRFSNDHTSSRVMTMAAQLMAAGANQQLIAAKLQEAHDIGPNAAEKPRKDDSDNGDESGDSNSSSRDNKPKKEKRKKDDNSLKIERDHKSEDKPEDKKEEQKEAVSSDDSTPAPAAEIAAVEAALSQAEPTKDVEKELADQLAEVAPSIPAPASSPVELEQELNRALDGNQSTDAIAAELAAVPAPAPEVTTADQTPAAPAPRVDDGMPGFEALEVPAPEPPLDPVPAPQISDAIDGRSGSAYVETGAPAKYDAPVESLITGADGSPDQYVDPFSTPLAPLPDLHESKDVAPAVEEQPAAPQDTPAPASPEPAMTLEELEKTAAPAPSVPPLPPNDLPPLPPLPDFSNLPPLPPPPPPPVFDQPASAPAPSQSGAISSDKLGDIFGDAPAQPETPAAPPTPPKPGQFQIPGM